MRTKASTVSLILQVKATGHLLSLKRVSEVFYKNKSCSQGRQVDLEKEILSLSQSVKELLDEKEKTKDLLRQLEERTRRFQREHQDPTLVNEAQKVRPLRPIWARALSTGLNSQADEAAAAAAESTKRKGDLSPNPLGLREAALIVYDASRDQFQAIVRHRC